MVPVPSDPELVENLRIGTPAELHGAHTRSYLPDGRCVGWWGRPLDGGRVAIDAELSNLPPPRALVQRFGEEAFWERWTRAECAAKLADVPIVRWVRVNGLTVPEGSVELVTVRADWLDPHLVVTVAAQHVA